MPWLDYEKIFGVINVTLARRIRQLAREKMISVEIREMFPNVDQQRIILYEKRDS